MNSISKGWVKVMALCLVSIGIVGSCSGSELTSSVVVSGSSTVEPITIRVAEQFNAQDPTVDLLIDGPGTGDGFELFCDDKTDINDASSKIAPDQIEACEANGIDFIELQIGNDGIVTMTSEGNDRVGCLALADIYALVGPESQGVDRWSEANELALELGGRDSLPDVALSIVGPGEESGTFTSFVELVIEKFNEERDQLPTTRPDYQASADDNVIIQGVQGSPTSFGWAGYAFAAEAEGIRILEVEADHGCVAPTAATIADGSYPISRPLFIYVNAERARTNPALERFVDFYLSDPGARSVGTVGYVDLTEDDLARTRQRWQDRTTGAAA